MAAAMAFVHHLAAFTLVSALAIEMVLLREELTLVNARKLLRIDGVYGIAAVLLLFVGLGRVFGSMEKGSYFYFHTWTFIAKLSLFILIGLLSIIPTAAFMSWRGAVRQGQVPQVTPERMRRLRMIVHVELLGVVFILLLAALMAKGIGLVM